MNDRYNLFGLTENCSDEEFERAYQEKRKIYAEDRFLEGQAGNEAAKKLTELDMAYRDLKAERKERYFDEQQTSSGAFDKVEEYIRKGDLHSAQHELDEFNDRGAEWHYLQAVIFFKKNWHNESKKQLEIAMQMDPSNDKYRNSYRKLEEKMRDSANKNFTSYNQSGNGQQYNEPQQMGGDGCCQWCCEMAICNMMLNCFCNSCG